MRSHPAMPCIALALVLLAPATVVAQFIEGDDIFLTDSTPEIAFSDTSGIVGFNWSIRAYDEYFRIVDTAAGAVYLNIDPALSSIALGGAASSGGQSSTALGVSASSSGNFSTALGYAATSTGVSSMALGRSAISSGTDSAALGYGANSEGSSSTALGRSANSDGDHSAALGDSANSGGDLSTAVGYSASSSGPVSVALGRSAGAYGPYGIALGPDTRSYGQGGIALGRSATANEDNSAALGRVAVSDGESSTALGHMAYVSQDNSVVLGSIAGVNGAAVYANVGIGTPAPAEAMDVERSGAAARFQLTAFTDTASEAPQFIQRRARGSRTAPIPIQINDNLGLFSFRGHNGVTMGGSRATITAQAAADFSNSSTPTRLIFATTPVGQTTPQSVLVITPDGKVQVNGVNLNVPDYVFEEDYELMPLSELKSFIDENGHLPGIAPAHEVQSEGLDLAGSQMDLLQKVEELTLYALQQQERIAELEALQERMAHLEAQQERIDDLEAQLTRALAALD